MRLLWWLLRWLGLWEPREVRVSWDSGQYITRTLAEQREREQPWLKYRY